ncbi:MAG: cell envelope-related transcriptional attenuator [Acidimicrobiales bacterium]|nr:cell envelope-related transcriptional attenuator [Acidimicrobiales bacterium]
MAFAVVLVALVGTIPVLGRTGYRIITDSTDGRLARGGAEPGEPGYEELVTPSPTALVIHKDATTGMPVNLTFLSLAGDGGGTVIFVPLDTALARPGFGFDRLRTAYSIVVDADVPDDQADGVLGQQTGAVLNVGIGQVIVLDDAGWERSVAPVAPLDLDNPDPLDLGGTELLTGPIQVDAGLVGPYLRAAREGEDDANRFFRQEQLWRAWLASVASSTRADAVPGESTAGIGLFARRMALGPVTYATLPGTFGSGPSPLYVPDANEVNALIADAVPAPTAAYPGSRVPVRVLNGVAAADIPTEITKLVVGFGGSVDVVGNGPAFDSARTDIVYGDPAQKAFADLLRAGLGATGEVRQDPATPDNIGVTVILGKDLLGDEVATTTPGGGSGARNFTSSTTTTAIGGP